MRPISFLSSAASCLLFSFCIAFSAGCGGGKAATAAPPVSNPTTPAAMAPAVTAVTPTTVLAGSAAFTLQINGTGFVSGAVAFWNGTPLTTTFVSVTQLTAAVPASLASLGGSFTITVVNPDGGTSSSSTSSSVAVENPAPTVASISPASVTAGTSATDVVVKGTGFIQDSVASFAGKLRTTTVKSDTELTMALTAADLSAAGEENVAVANPSPGGGTSKTVVLTVSPAPPVITGIQPSSLTVGSPATVLTVSGTGFLATTSVSLSDYPQTPTILSPTALQITVPAYNLQTANPLYLAVSNAGQSSNTFPVPVLNPVPVIQSLATPTVTAGAPAFNMTINASGLVTGTQVNVNGAVVPGDSTYPGSIAVQISASQLAQVGTISVSLTNPAPGGGTSNIAKLNVISGSNYLRSVSLPANSLVWNPKQQLIYAAVPAMSSTDASDVAAIDPASGNIVATQQMPAEPTLLAISDDQQYLYVAMPSAASIERLKLPSLAVDIQWSTGAVPSSSYPVIITSLQVAPGQPHTVAVAGIPSANAAKQLAVYDDGVLRPNTATGSGAPYDYPVDVLTWGADASTIYGSTSTISGGPEFIYAINTQGATESDLVYGAFSDFPSQLLYDSAKSRLYDSQGDVVDATSGRSLGSFPINSKSLALDSGQRRAYFMATSPYPDGVNSAEQVTEIQVFDQDRFTSLGSILLPASVGGGEHLIRWGTAGLAFDSGSNIYILDGPFVTPGALPTSRTGTFLTPVPQIAGISPQAVAAGSADTTITLKGQNFSAATTVSWNNNALATTFINNTQIQATIPAVALSTPAAAPLFVENSPGEGISNVVAFSVLPNLGASTQLTALNLSGTDLADLVWNAATKLLYVGASNLDSLNPDTIATIDPVAGTILSTTQTSGNPFVLAISADDQYLYAGFSNYANVQRYKLPSLAPDLLIPLGIGDPAGGRAPGSIASCDFAVSMRVSPMINTTIAVTQGNQEIDELGCGATAVIDGAVPRPVNSSGPDLSELTWGADNSTLYAQGTDNIDHQPISSLTVSSTGLTLNQSSSGDVYLGYRPHFDAGTGLIYSDGGAVTQPSDLSMVANFNASALMVPDSTTGLAYFLGQTNSQTALPSQGTDNYTLQIYDLHSYALLNSIVIPNVIGLPNQMVRWGSAGIAFLTESGGYEGNNAPGLTYILSDPSIAGNISPPLRKKASEREHVHLTWKLKRNLHTSSATHGAFN